MSEKVEAAAQALSARFSLERREFRDQISLLVQPDQIVEVCQVLRDELGFDLLSSVTAVDYWPQESPRFHVVYHIYSLEGHDWLGLRVPVPGIDPVVPTIEGVYPNANWFEREIWDLFGIRFEGHSDMRRILMPFDWEGHPLRKDYPLGYEEVQFTFNFDEIDRKKPYAKE